MYLRTTILALLAIAALAAPALRAEAAAANQEDSARKLLTLIQQNKFGPAQAMFTSALKAALSPTRLRQTNEANTRNLGAFKNFGTINSRSIDKYEVISISCVFAKGEIMARVAFTKDGKVAALRYGAIDAAAIGK